MILRRLNDSRLSEVLPAWKGSTVVCIGSGPSLTREHIEAVYASHSARKSFCIAINASYLWTPWADVCYFADAKFWAWHNDGVKYPALDLGAGQVKQRFADFKGQKCSIRHSGAHIKDEAVHLLANIGGTGNHSVGISLDPRKIATGKHSGYQALNVAILSGASKVLLLGYDGAIQNGKSHFHGSHPKATAVGAYQMYRQAFAQGERDIKATGVRVVNCSPGSQIAAFEHGELSRELSL